MKWTIQQSPAMSPAQRISNLQLHVTKYEREAAMAREAGKHRLAARIERNVIAALRSLIRETFEEMSAGGDLH